MQQYSQNDQRDDRSNGAYDVPDVLLDVVSELPHVGDLIEVVGEGVQYGSESVIDAGFSILEVLGELLGGLLS